MNAERGVTHVLGVILMAAFAVTVATTVAVAGVSMIGDSERSIENSQVESSLASLSSDAADLSDNESVEFDLGTADGDLSVREETGELTIRHSDHGEIYNEPINSLEYTSSNGDRVAHQGGGVFRERAGGSTVVSAPDFYYRDNALSFPIQTVEGDFQSSGTLSGELTLEREERHFPTDEENESNPLEGGTVYIELESEYCQGWEEYFDQQTRGSVSESCATDGHDTDEGEVQVELSVPFELGPEAFEHETAIGAAELDGASEDDDDDLSEVDGDYISADSVIENKASDRDEADYLVSEDDEDADFDELPPTVEDPGFYYLDDDLESQHDFDTSDFEEDEEIEVYVDGNVTAVEDGLTVEGGDNQVAFYVDGNFDTSESNDAVVGNEDAPSQTVMFVSSSGYVFSDGDNPHSHVNAIVYAPDSEGYMQANNDMLDGAIIIDKMEFQTPPNSNTFEFDDSITTEGEEFTFYDEGSGPEFYYLHVTEKTLTASD